MIDMPFMLSRALALSLCVLSCACAPSNKAPAMTPIEDFSGPAWQRWTPSAPRADAHLPAGTIAFDHWRLEPGEYTAEVWAALFPILSSLRTPTCSPAEVDTSLDILLAVLEPVDHDASELQMDLTFALHAGDGPRREWLILRAWRASDGTIPALTIALEHDTSAPSPTTVMVWGYPGYERAPTFSAKLTNATIGCEAGARPTDELTSSPSASAAISFGLLHQLLWENVTRAHYTTPIIALKHEERDGSPFPAAAGLPQRKRRLEEIDSASHFPPVVDLEDTPFR